MTLRTGDAVRPAANLRERLTGNDAEQTGLGERAVGAGADGSAVAAHGGVDQRRAGRIDRAAEDHDLPVERRRVGVVVMQIQRAVHLHAATVLTASVPLLTVAVPSKPPKVSIRSELIVNVTPGLTVVVVNSIPSQL